MDRRGYLAQSLNTYNARSPGRWRRPLRRWFTTLVSLDVPRGVEKGPALGAAMRAAAAAWVEAGFPNDRAALDAIAAAATK